LTTDPDEVPSNCPGIIIADALLWTNACNLGSGSTDDMPVTATPDTGARVEMNNGVISTNDIAPDPVRPDTLIPVTIA